MSVTSFHPSTTCRLRIYHNLSIVQGMKQTNDCFLSTRKQFLLIPVFLFPYCYPFILSIYPHSVVYFDQKTWSKKITVMCVPVADFENELHDSYTYSKELKAQTKKEAIKLSIPFEEQLHLVLIYGLIDNMTVDGKSE